MSDSSGFILDRYTTMGDLTASIRRMLVRGNALVALLVGFIAAYLVIEQRPGAIAFVLIAIGAVAALVIWANAGVGLPLLPMFAVQHLMTYGLPIVVGHEIVTKYPSNYVTEAGLNVFVFLLAMAVVWRMAMQVMQPHPPQAYALEGIDRDGIKGLTRLGFGLAGGATGFLLLQSLHLTDTIMGLLPGGSYPIVWASVSAASTCGFFLVSMIISTGDVPIFHRVAFWSLLTVNCFLSSAGFLLSAAAITIASVTIGFFWGTGRMPWRFTIVVMLVLSFLNLGKFTMRERYWHRDEEDMAVAPDQGLWEIPNAYAEWTNASFDALVGNQSKSVSAFRDAPEAKPQSLLDRVNNLQNLLFVIDATDGAGIPLLHGRTYSLIPRLLIPRILWPGEKPRSHEGQVLLNTHFGRQDLRSTFETYIAWGLLAEAYGNFGPISGAAILGAVLGVMCAWLENFTTRKPLLSTEGFVSFAIFLGLANSYEMVASVMVTSIFQSIVPIVAACAPFVRRMTVRRPVEEVE